jgi:hypothetical protein
MAALSITVNLTDIRCIKINDYVTVQRRGIEIAEDRSALFYWHVLSATIGE